MTAVEHGTSCQDALAMKQIGQLREFCIHVAVYLVVCIAVLAALSFLSPDKLWAGGLLWLVWGAGLSIHAAKTFLFGGAWEQRRVERKLGRPL